MIETFTTLTKKDNMTSRKNSDEYYVIELCDEILGQKASRQQTFDFLRGDGTPGRKLPVDAYYPNLKLVVEYKERQHTESVLFFNKKNTVSGVCRDEQRRIYDQRRRDVLPKHGIQMVEISYSDLKHDNHKRLIRDRQADIAVIRMLLSNVKKENLKVGHKNTGRQTVENTRNDCKSKEPVKDGTQTWIYQAYHKFGCLFIFIVLSVTLFLSSYLTISVFNLNEGQFFIIETIILFVVACIFHHYTIGIDEKLQKGNQEVNSSIYSDYNQYPICCPQCGSNNIGPADDGDFVCIDCGLRWYQTY